MAETQNLDGEIGNRVRAAAKAAGITHEALALEAGIKLRTFGYLVAGKAHWRLVDVVSIADVLGVDDAELTFGRTVVTR